MSREPRRARWMALVIAGVVCVPSLTEAKAQPPALPPAMRAALAARWPHWRFFRPSSEGCDASQDSEATIARGDFDGDGVLDTAALVEPKPGAEPLVAVRLTSRRTRALLVLDWDGAEVIDVTPRGKTVNSMDLEARTSHPITLERDGIMTGSCDGAWNVYVFRRGRFVVVAGGC